jgi:hypothetical protein
MKILTLLALLLTSVNVYADWVDYSCYRNANQKGEQTDKMYSYNDATRKIKLDKKDKEYAGHFRGQHIISELPSGKNKTEVDFNKSDGHLTLTLLGGPFNGRKFNLVCFKEDTIQAK